MGLTRENKKFFICPEESMNAFVDLASQQPSHLLVAELVFCLAKPSPPATLRPHVQVVDPILSFEGERLAQTWPLYQHWFRDGHSRGRPPGSAWLRLGLCISTGSGMGTLGAGHPGLGLLLWLSWLRICPQCGRPGFNPWVGKIPWRRERLPTPVFWFGEFCGLYSPWGCKESDTTE